MIWHDRYDEMQRVEFDRTGGSSRSFDVKVTNIHDITYTFSSIGNYLFLYNKLRLLNLIIKCFVSKTNNLVLSMFQKRVNTQNCMITWSPKRLRYLEEQLAEKSIGTIVQMTKVTTCVSIYIPVPATKLQNIFSDLEIRCLILESYIDSHSSITRLTLYSIL